MKWLSNFFSRKKQPEPVNQGIDFQAAYDQYYPTLQSILDSHIYYLFEPGNVKYHAKSALAATLIGELRKTYLNKYLGDIECPEIRMMLDNMFVMDVNTRVYIADRMTFPHKVVPKDKKKAEMRISSLTVVTTPSLEFGTKQVRHFLAFMGVHEREKSQFEPSQLLELDNLVFDVHQQLGVRGSVISVDSREDQTTMRFPIREDASVFG